MGEDVFEREAGGVEFGPDAGDGLGGIVGEGIAGVGFQTGASLDEALGSHIAGAALEAVGFGAKAGMGGLGEGGFEAVQDGGGIEEELADEVVGGAGVVGGGEGAEGFRVEDGEVGFGQGWGGGGGGG